SGGSERQVRSAGQADGRLTERLSAEFFGDGPRLGERLLSGVPVALGPDGGRGQTEQSPAGPRTVPADAPSLAHPRPADRVVHAFGPVQIGTCVEVTRLVVRAPAGQRLHRCPDRSDCLHGALAYRPVLAQV